MSGVTGPGQQLSQVSARLKEGDRFDLVFLTVGGNDIMFADIARNCLAHNVLSPFSKGAGSLPFLNPCAADPNSITYKPQRTLLNAQTPLLRDVYQQIAKTFAAQGLDVPPIIVSPYPLMAPMDPQLRWWCHDPLDVSANISQVGYFLDLQRSLNGLVEEAVRQAHDEDGIPVYFAPSVELAFQPDNTMCGDPTYVVPLSLTNAIGPDADTPYHPNVAGHRAWALALARWAEQPGLELQRGTKPPGRRTLPWVFELAPRTVIDPAKSFSWAGQGDVDVVVTGLTPGTPVSAVVHSNPAALGVAHADAQGRAVISGRLEPTLVPPGLHTLQVTMTPAGGETTVVESQLYVTRNAPYWIWGVLGLGVLLLITGLVHLRSLRRSVT